jgi:hypothetical protein
VWLGAILAATKMHKDYMVDRNLGFPVGPEGYAEDWFKMYMVDLEITFERLVMNCFLQILGQTNGKFSSGV